MAGSTRRTWLPDHEQAGLLTGQKSILTAKMAAASGANTERRWLLPEHPS
jgi:hypothetical protein